MQSLLTSACLAALIVAAFPGPSHGQPRHNAANAVPKNDPIHPLLAEYQAAMVKREEDGKQVRSTFRDWIKVDSAAAAKLFPNLRFASLRWDMHRDPED